MVYESPNFVVCTNNGVTKTPELQTRVESSSTLTLNGISGNSDQSSFSVQNGCEFPSLNVVPYLSFSQIDSVGERLDF